MYAISSTLFFFLDLNVLMYTKPISSETSSQNKTKQSSQWVQLLHLQSTREKYQCRHWEIFHQQQHLLHLSYSNSSRVPSLSDIQLLSFTVYSRFCCPCFLLASLCSLISPKSINPPSSSLYIQQQHLGPPPVDKDTYHISNKFPSTQFTTARIIFFSNTYFQQCCCPPQQRRGAWCERRRFKPYIPTIIVGNMRS